MNLRNFFDFFRTRIGPGESTASSEPLPADVLPNASSQFSAAPVTAPIRPARSQYELPSLVEVMPPIPPDEFTSGPGDPPCGIDTPWATVIEAARNRAFEPAAFFNRLSMCAGLWFLWTGGFATPNPKRPVDLNLRWQRLPDGRFILADFARLGFWGMDMESLLARVMIASLIPLESVACSETPDGQGLFHSSVVRSAWKNTHSVQEWKAFLDELEAAYGESFFGAEIRGARQLVEVLAAA